MTQKKDSAAAAASAKKAIKGNNTKPN